MYRFFIDDVKSYASDIAEKLLNGVRGLQRPVVRKKDGSVDESKGLALLKSKLENVHAADGYLEYIQHIIDHYDDILTLHPSQFEKFKDDYFNIAGVNLSTKFKIDNVHQEFYKHVASYMCCDTVKKYVRRIMIDFLKIRKCIYCNDIEIQEMDHFKPEAKYPFLCTSFFNLFPSCKRCNGKKNKWTGKNEFCLYREKESEDCNPFKFDFPEMLEDYLTYENDKHTIKFSSPSGYAKEEISDACLDIEGRYNDELSDARKHLKNVLNKYKHQMGCLPATLNACSELNITKKDEIEFVLGDCYKVEDIHKDRFVKMTIDFGKETGMLK